MYVEWVLQADSSQPQLDPFSCGRGKLKEAAWTPAKRCPPSSAATDFWKPLYFLRHGLLGRVRKGTKKLYLRRDIWGKSGWTLRNPPQSCKKLISLPCVDLVHFSSLVTHFLALEAPAKWITHSSGNQSCLLSSYRCAEKLHPPHALLFSSTYPIVL